MDKLRIQHINKFRRLSPEQRLEWALLTGWAIRNELTAKAKKIQDYCRHGGKKQFSSRMGQSS